MDEYEGWCGGHTVIMGEARTTNVLGPDGEPITYVRKPEIVGFDLRQKRNDHNEGQ